jgi:ribosomal protein S18 acetylase RimI-like enzyme
MPGVFPSPRRAAIRVDVASRALGLARIEIVPIGAAETRPLRRGVLRADHPEDPLVFPGDDAPDSAHFGAQSPSGELLSVASVMRETPPWDSAPRAWRLRGMATSPEARRSGLGTRLLAAIVTHVEARGGGLLWCNARIPAVRF